VSYIVDGFAAAGIVLGSRLVAQAHDPALAEDAEHHLRLLIRRVLTAGGITGIVFSAYFYFQENAVIHFFTFDEQTIALLRQGMWALLILIQPINSLVFVYDGLMYASQSFTFIRNYFLIGFVLIFCPVMGFQFISWQSLWGVWLAKAAMNIWRLAGAAYLIHFLYMKEFSNP